MSLGIWDSRAVTYRQGRSQAFFGSTHKVRLILNCTDHSQKYICYFNHTLILKYQLRLTVLSSNVSTSCQLHYGVLNTLHSVSSSTLVDVNGTLKTGCGGKNERF